MAGDSRAAKESVMEAAADGGVTVSSGIPGLDEALRGGLPRDRMYLLEGESGTGKTTFALQFLLEGVRQGQPVLYITLAETRSELEASAASHGWSLAGIELCELVGATPEFSPEAQYTVFRPADVELGATLQKIVEAVQAIRPARLVIDSLVELRLLANDPLRYRRDLLAVRQLLLRHRCTSLLVDQVPTVNVDVEGRSLVHGIIRLEQVPREYGEERRRLRIIKLRGVKPRGGWHDFTILQGGLAVYPRLVAAEHHATFLNEPVPSGLPALDVLLGGGLPAGTSTLLVGPAGTGKSALATQYAVAAADRGLPAAIFTFDEGVPSFRARGAGLSASLLPHIEGGRIAVRQIDPAELSPGEFAHLVRQAVERDRAKVVVVDSLNGYLHAMPDERSLLAQLHELLTYLNQYGVLSFLVVSQFGAVGNGSAPVSLSYLTDNVLLFRFFEAAGRVRRALSVLKKRTGAHENTIRELRFDTAGIQIGEPLTLFQGVLTGTPQFLGDP
jgi:circadian clock protein KaiC